MKREFSIPYTDLIDQLEMLLVEKGLVKPDEFLLYADFGLDTDENGNVIIYCEIQDQIEYQPSEVPATEGDNIVQYV